MGRALIGGLLRSGTRPELISVGEAISGRPRSSWRVTSASRHRRQCPGHRRGRRGGAGGEAPGRRRGADSPLRRSLAQGQPLLISVCAGTQVASLRPVERRGVPVVRAMPNRPALVGAGVTGALCTARGERGAARAMAQKVMQAVGEVVWVPSEAALDAVTALSGSGPAYFFLLAQLMAEAGTRLGLEPAAAQQPGERDPVRRGHAGAACGRRPCAPARRGHLPRGHHGGCRARHGAGGLRGIIDGPCGRRGTQPRTGRAET